MPTPDQERLLRRYQPVLRYDAQEQYFADSPAEWTDNPGNVLRRTAPGGGRGEVIAAATPRPGQAQLSLDFLRGLGEKYPNGMDVELDDYIAGAGTNYREQYAALRRDERYRNRMYGRAKEDSDGRLWLQYWLYYFYNDYDLAARIGLHEGDWEMVQFRIDGEVPDLAVYAQHTHAERALWREVEKEGERPVVWVARGSHASYFARGFHQTEAWYDITDGERRPKRGVVLETIDDDGPAWVRWPGRWGGTPTPLKGIDQPSPRGPSQKPHWNDPDLLLREARTHTTRAARERPAVDARRDGGRLRIDYDLSRERAETLAVTVNSRDDRELPHTYPFTVGAALRGEMVTRFELNPAHHYDITIRTADARGVPSDSLPILLDPVGRRVPGLNPLLGAVARAVAAVRRRFGRRRRGGGAPSDP